MLGRAPIPAELSLQASVFLSPSLPESIFSLLISLPLAQPFSLPLPSFVSACLCLSLSCPLVHFSVLFQTHKRGSGSFEKACHLNMHLSFFHTVLSQKEFRAIRMYQMFCGETGG